MRIGTFRAFRKTNADRHVEHLKLDVVDRVFAVPIKDRRIQAVVATTGDSGLNTIPFS